MRFQFRIADSGLREVQSATHTSHSPFYSSPLRKRSELRRGKPCYLITYSPFRLPPPNRLFRNLVFDPKPLHTLCLLVLSQQEQAAFQFLYFVYERPIGFERGRSNNLLQFRERERIVLCNAGDLLLLYAPFNGTDNHANGQEKRSGRDGYNGNDKLKIVHGNARQMAGSPFPT